MTNDKRKNARLADDQRKATRRPMRYIAWVSMGENKLVGCILSDISDTGARIDFDDADKIPDEFFLMLSNRGSPKRKCKVVWRDPKHVGVQFDRKLGNPNATLMPMPVFAEPTLVPDDPAKDEAETAS